MSLGKQIGLALLDTRVFQKCLHHPNINISATLVASECLKSRHSINDYLNWAKTYDSLKEEGIDFKYPYCGEYFDGGGPGYLVLRKAFETILKPPATKPLSDWM